MEILVLIMRASCKKSHIAGNYHGFLIPDSNWYDHLVVIHLETLLSIPRSMWYVSALFDSMFMIAT